MVGSEADQADRWWDRRQTDGGISDTSTQGTGIHIIEKHTAAGRTEVMESAADKQNTVNFTDLSVLRVQLFPVAHFSTLGVNIVECVNGKKELNSPTWSVQVVSRVHLYVPSYCTLSAPL